MLQILDQNQVQMMLSRSLPGERVLYTSTMCMAFHFIHGALRQGAVFYHPSFAGDTQFEADWLRRPGLRFAVTYNPTVYHPSYEALDEKTGAFRSPSTAIHGWGSGGRNSRLIERGSSRFRNFSGFRAIQQRGDQAIYCDSL